MNLQVAEENEEAGAGINLEDVLQNDEPSLDAQQPVLQPNQEDDHNEITDTQRALHTTNDNNRDSHSNASSTEVQSTNSSELATELPRTSHQGSGVDARTDLPTSADVDSANNDDSR